MIGCGSLSAGSDAGEIYANAPLTRTILDQSLAQGRRYLVSIQRPNGNFYYERNFITGGVTADDSAVRQAGALWSLALLHLDQPSDDTRQAVERGLAFFEQHSKLTKDGRRYIRYPGEPGSTGAIALATLSLIEFVRAEPDHADAEKHRRHLDQYVDMLLSLRRDNGQFYGGYDRHTGRPKDAPSPFFDGETLLALAKTVNYLGREDLKSMVTESAAAMFQIHFAKATAAGRSKSAKEFYQWGLMSFFEMDDDQWPSRRENARRSFDMALWYVEETKARPPKINDAAAYEGLVSAWELARRYGETDIQSILGRHIENGLLRLTSLQVGGPLPNEFLQTHPARDALTAGGVMSSSRNADLRIDVTQHQMHAVVLARRFMYGGE